MKKIMVSGKHFKCSFSISDSIPDDQISRYQDFLLMMMHSIEATFHSGRISQVAAKMRKLIKSEITFLKELIEE